MQLSTSDVGITPSLKIDPPLKLCSGPPSTITVEFTNGTHETTKTSTVLKDKLEGSAVKTLHTITFPIRLEDLGPGVQVFLCGSDIHGGSVPKVPVSQINGFYNYNATTHTVTLNFDVLSDAQQQTSGMELPLTANGPLTSAFMPDGTVLHAEGTPDTAIPANDIYNELREGATVSICFENVLFQCKADGNYRPFPPNAQFSLSPLGFAFGDWPQPSPERLFFGDGGQNIVLSYADMCGCPHIDQVDANLHNDAEVSTQAVSSVASAQNRLGISIMPYDPGLDPAAEVGTLDFRYASAHPDITPPPSPFLFRGPLTNNVPIFFDCTTLTYQAVLTMPSYGKLSLYTFLDEVRYFPNPNDHTEFYSFTKTGIGTNASTPSHPFLLLPPAVRVGDDDVYTFTGAFMGFNGEIEAPVVLTGCGKAMAPHLGGQDKFSLRVQAICDGCVDCAYTTACLDTFLDHHCNSPCDNAAVPPNLSPRQSTRSFSLERETYGTVDPTGAAITSHAQAIAAGIELGVAYPCDHLHVQSTGSVLPNGGANQRLGFVMNYISPALTGNNFFQFLEFIEGTVTLNNTQTYTLALDDLGSAFFGTGGWDLTPAVANKQLHIRFANTVPPGNTAFLNQLMTAGGDLRLDMHLQVRPMAGNVPVPGNYILSPIIGQFVSASGTGQVLESCDPYMSNLEILNVQTTEHFDILEANVTSPENGWNDATGVCERRFVLETRVLGGKPGLDEFLGEIRPVVQWAPGTSKLQLTLPANVSFTGDAQFFVRHRPGQIGMFNNQVNSTTLGQVVTFNSFQLNGNMNSVWSSVLLDRDRFSTDMVIRGTLRNTCPATATFPINDAKVHFPYISQFFAPDAACHILHYPTGTDIAPMPYPLATFSIGLTHQTPPQIITSGPAKLGDIPFALNGWDANCHLEFPWIRVSSRGAIEPGKDHWLDTVPNAADVVIGGLIISRNGGTLATTVLAVGSDDLFAEDSFHNHTGVLPGVDGVLQTVPAAGDGIFDGIIAAGCDNTRTTAAAVGDDLLVNSPVLTNVGQIAVDHDSNTVGPTYTVGHDANGYFRLHDINSKWANAPYISLENLTLANCQTRRPFDVHVEYGYSCVGYPTTPQATGCSVQCYDFLAMFEESGLAVEIKQFPPVKANSAPYGPCETLEYQVLVQSNLPASVTNPHFCVMVPAGINFTSVSAVQTYYNNGYTKGNPTTTSLDFYNTSNNTSSGITPSLNSQTGATTYDFDVGNIAYNGAGMPYMDSVCFTFRLNSSCQTNQSVALRFQAKGLDLCGNPVQSFVRQTPSIQISGALGTVTPKFTGPSNSIFNVTCLPNGTTQIDPAHTGGYPAAVDNCGNAIDPSVISYTDVPDPSHCSIIRTYSALVCGTSILFVQTLKFPTEFPVSFPVIDQCPLDRVLPLNAQCKGVLPNMVPEVLAHDDCYVASITQAPPANTILKAGTHTVTYTVTDECGHSMQCHNTVTVPSGINFWGCGNQTFPCTNDAGALINYAEPTATSMCSNAALSVSCSPPDGQFPIGVTQVTCTAVDAFDNIATCTFTVTVVGKGVGQWTWARRAGGASVDVGRSIAVDAVGNVYVTGSFTENIKFPPSTLQPSGVSLTGGATQIFVAKYLPNGTLVWAKSAGGNGAEVGYGVALDAQGDPYVTGSIGSKSSFAGVPDITPLGTSDIFVAKFDRLTGTCLWAVKQGESGADLGQGIAIAPDGKVVVTGGWVKGGNQEVCVLQFDASNGSLLGSAFSSGAAGHSAIGSAIAVDSSNDLYVTGTYSGSDLTLAPGGAPLTALGLTSGFGRAFVAKFDHSNLAAVWLRHGNNNISACANHSGNGIAVDKATSTVYVAGSFQGTIDFGSGFSMVNPRNTVSSDCIGQFNDYYILKLATPSGALIWAKKGTDNFTYADPAANDEVLGIAVDPSGNPVITGFVRLAATTPFVSGGNKILVATHNASNGDLRWTLNANGTGSNVPDDTGLGVAVDSAGSVHLTGFHTQSLDFPPQPLLVSVGARDIFVAKMGVNCSFGLLNKIINPSFELASSAIPANTFTFVNSGNLTGWTTVGSGGNVHEIWSNLLPGTWRASDGNNQLELNASSVDQTTTQVVTNLSTQALTTFGFDYTGRNGIVAGTPNNDFTVTLQPGAGPAQTISFDPPAYTAAVGWQHFEFTFVPISPTLTISFRGLPHQAIASGGHIDNVVLTQNYGALGDTDGDGIPDAWELAYNLQPTVFADAAADADGDGMSNLQEYLFGTDPKDAQNMMRLLPIPQVSPGAHLRFTALANRSYIIEKSATLVGAWTTFSTVVAQPSDHTVDITDPSNNPRNFYRLRTP